MSANEWDDEFCPDADDFDGCEHGVGFDCECAGCEADPIGCIFPGKCCMPGTHLESECYTAEMMEVILTPTRKPIRSSEVNAKERVKAKWPDATAWRYIDCAGHHVEITDKPDYSEDDSEEEIILGNGDDLEAAWQDAASHLEP